MRIAFLSDIHANGPALRAALEAARAAEAERIYVAGDLVGDGPHPVEVVRELRERGVEAVRGNVDRKVLALAEKKRKKLEKRLERAKRQRRNRAWTALQLLDAEVEHGWLGSLPAERPLRIEGRSVLLLHGSPLGDTDYLFPSLTPEALHRKLEPLEGEWPAVIVCGHSHLPFAREVGGVWVVNCGSVGRPKDGDPRGSFAVVDLPGEGPIGAEIVRFDYPVSEVTEAIGERGVPGIDPDEYRRGIKT